jgi:aubergine-like protein
VENSGYVENPPSGCVIDKAIVECEDSKEEFDFFMIPSYANQGCCLPTHFYCPYNDSPLTKEVIEKLTFDLCHYYFNWQGPIKVPAPCMYAHKIAELYTKVGHGLNSSGLSDCVNEALHYL